MAYCIAKFDFENASISHDDTVTCTNLAHQILQNAALEYSQLSFSSFPECYRNTNNATFKFLYFKVYKQLALHNKKAGRRADAASPEAKQESSPLSTNALELRPLHPSSQSPDSIKAAGSGGDSGQVVVDIPLEEASIKQLKEAAFEGLVKQEQPAVSLD